MCQRPRSGRSALGRRHREPPRAREGELLGRPRAWPAERARPFSKSAVVEVPLVVPDRAKV